MKKIIFIQYLLLVAAITLIALDVIIYQRYKSSENFIKVITPIIEERDTTYSLRNYEVLTDSINKLYKDWMENETISK